jgi:hypothetical protein
MGVNWTERGESRGRFIGRGGRADPRHSGFPAAMQAPPPAAPAPGATHAPGRARLGKVALSLAAFALVVETLRATAAPAGGSVIAGKLQCWERHARDYDTVFLGSSHVHRAFVPGEFDRACAELQVPTRSFNFGVQAVHLLEQRYLLRRILAAAPHLERVFFEYQWLCPQVDPDNAFDPRTVYWHDLDTTLLAVERARHWQGELGDELVFVEGEAESRSVFSLLERAFPAGERAASQHAQHFLADRLMIGRGKDVLRGLLGRGGEQVARFHATAGYTSLEDDEAALAAQGDARNTYAQRRARFLANRAQYLAAVDELDAAERSFGDGEWMNAELARIDDLDLVRAIAAETRARGVEFVLVVMPSLSSEREFERRLMEELGALVLRYNLPESHPELYAPGNHYDSGHLSAEGARYFSRLLARDYAGQGGARFRPGGGERVQ